VKDHTPHYFLLNLNKPSSYKMPFLRTQKLMDCCCKNFGLITRPNASPGLWLAALLPAAYGITALRMSKTASFDHKFTAILSFGLFLQSIGIFARILFEGKGLRIATRVIPPSTTSFLVWFCLKQNVFFSAFTGSVFILLYGFLFTYLIRRLPKSFTLGEAAIVTQAVVLFLGNFFTYLPNVYHHQMGGGEMEKIKPILLIGIAHVLLVIWLLDMFKVLRHSLGFYALIGYVLVFLVIVPTPHTQEPQVLVLLEIFTKDIYRFLTVLAYASLTGIAALTVTFFVITKQASSTRVRKIFHVLVICVFIPGLLYQCTLLFTTSVLALTVFIMLEVIRIIKLPPFHKYLQPAVQTFIDEQDAGLVAFTPIYLLVGCSLPLWIHPSPCDLTDSAGLELIRLMAGVLSVGFGDMAASIVGSKVGKHKWPGRKKSVEGTVANVMVQMAVVAAFWGLKLVTLNKVSAAYVGIAIIVNALVEAFTDQVDNLVLPLITFCILALY